jgi:hypothetical protein
MAARVELREITNEEGNRLLRIVRLGDAESCHLGVGDPATAISGLLGQEIVRRAINGSAESVEVGVHRGLQVDGDLSTADFGLSASNPSITALAVESTI